MCKPAGNVFCALLSGVEGFRDFSKHCLGFAKRQTVKCRNLGMWTNFEPTCHNIKLLATTLGGWVLKSQEVCFVGSVLDGFTT